MSIFTKSEPYTRPGFLDALPESDTLATMRAQPFRSAPRKIITIPLPGHHETVVLMHPWDATAEQIAAAIVEVEAALADWIADQGEAVKADVDAMRAAAEPVEEEVVS